NGKEMRQLPQKENGKKTPRTWIQRAARGCPADHWWQRARDRPERSVECAHPFQGRVSKDVNDDRDRSENGAERVTNECEIADPKDRQRRAQDKRVNRPHSSDW